MMAKDAQYDTLCYFLAKSFRLMLSASGHMALRLSFSGEEESLSRKSHDFQEAPEHLSSPAPALL